MSRERCIILGEGHDGNGLSERARFPRRGREMYGDYYWLLRVFDKARAARNRTINDYIYPCPIDREMFDHWGITPDAFDAALATCDSDEMILTWLEGNAGALQRDAANNHLLSKRLANLDKQDAEEGVAVA